MKTRIRVIELAVCICAAFGWWGVFYPELTMMPDTYRIVGEDAQDKEIYRTADWDFDREIYLEILQADAGQVRFKSRLLMSLKEIFE
ncbi:MAG: hypothetical protein NC094_04660 [Bacteroidales bacterium]|nr:hypothetical protein [Lachnoclostridium sp.]MCM1383982.1 hypothetical protein [Lachnoclostridium sp.]MCM1464691.1 hypothetical protein [Bacteroidales bacterium]